MKQNSALWKKIVAVVLVLVLAAGVFFAGYFVRQFTLPQYVLSYEWAIKTIKKNYYYDFDEKAAENMSLKELSYYLLDPYSTYYTAEEFEAVMRDNGGEKSGVGFSYNFIEGEGARIVTVVGNSPAYLRGLRAGDVVVSGTSGGKTTEFKSADDFNGFIDGKNTGEKFAFNCKDEKTVTNLSKEVYEASYTFMATKETAWSVTRSGSAPVLVEEKDERRDYLPKDAAYLRLDQFFGKAADEFGTLMKKFNNEGLKTLILDLRNNGGGYVDVMQDIGGYFTSSKTSKNCVAMTANYKNGKKEVYDCKKHSGAGLVKEDTKVYVLANSGTASASEALIGVLVDYGFVEYENIFLSDFSEEYLKFADGQEKTKQTYGKGIMQSTFYRFITGEALKLTTAQIYWPNGKCIHGVGLTEKDGCRLSPAEWTSTKDDSELQYICENYINQ